MVKNVARNLYQCEQCGLHYRDRATAEQCEAWCSTHQSCNIEIIAHAVESETPQPHDSGNS